MTQINEFKNCFKMFDGDLSSHDLRFITVTFIEFNLLPRFNQIIQIP